VARALGMHRDASGASMDRESGESGESSRSRYVDCGENGEHDGGDTEASDSDSGDDDQGAKPIRMQGALGFG
jgi:hypothetical protein